jgi:hypothetical protein
MDPFIPAIETTEAHLSRKHINVCACDDMFYFNAIICPAPAHHWQESTRGGMPRALMRVAVIEVMD